MNGESAAYAALRARLQAALADCELRRLGTGLRAVHRLESGNEALSIRLDGGELTLVASGGPADIALTAIS